MGYGACAFAAFASIYSYFIPFPESKSVLLISVAGYFLLNAVLVLYTGAIEKSVIYVGDKIDALGIVSCLQSFFFDDMLVIHLHPQQDPSVSLVISTHFERETANYSVEADTEITAVGAPKPSKKSHTKVTYHTGELFDEEGLFVASVFYAKVAALMNGDVMKLE